MLVLLSNGSPASHPSPRETYHELCRTFPKERDKDRMENADFLLIFNDSDYFVGFYSEGWRNLGRIACRDDICDVVVSFAQLPLERFAGEFGCEIFVLEFIMNYVGTTKKWKG